MIDYDDVSLCLVDSDAPLSHPKRKDISLCYCCMPAGRMGRGGRPFFTGTCLCPGSGAFFPLCLPQPPPPPDCSLTLLLPSSVWHWEDTPSLPYTYTHSSHLPHTPTRLIPFPTCSLPFGLCGEDMQFILMGLILPHCALLCPSHSFQTVPLPLTLFNMWLVLDTMPLCCPHLCCCSPPTLGYSPGGWDGSSTRRPVQFFDDDLVYRYLYSSYCSPSSPYLPHLPVYVGYSLQCGGM